MRWRAAAAGTAVIGAASVATWALAVPQGSLPATVVRAVADCAAAVVLGVAVSPFLDTDRHRREMIDRATIPLTVAAAVWLSAELARFLVSAAQSVGVSVGGLTMPTTVDFAGETPAGQAGLVGIVAAAIVGLLVVTGPRSAPTHVAVAGLVAVGVAARTLTGHFADSALGGFAVAVHTLAAVLWCGVLAGLVLTVEHRGRWARVLPRFSQMSLACVVVLLIGGVAGASSRFGSPADLFVTGYGRVLSAKVVVTAVLVALGWRNRTMWLPAARAHRATAVVSRARSWTELAIMAVALVLAAGLAITG